MIIDPVPAANFLFGKVCRAPFREPFLLWERSSFRERTFLIFAASSWRNDETVPLRSDLPPCREPSRPGRSRPSPFERRGAGGSVSRAGGRIFAGRAVYPNGMPAAGVRLGAFHAPSGVPRHFRKRADSREKQWETKSGPDGKFSFRGLPEKGFYDIAWYGRGGWSLFCERFCGYFCGYGDVPFETGRKDALVVVEEYRVRLRVRDDAGRPVPGARYTLLTAHRRESRIQWDSPWWGGSTADSGGEAYIEGTPERADLLRPGDRVVLAAWSDEFFPRVKEAVIVEGCFETAVDLFLGPPAPRGRLKLRIPASNEKSEPVDVVEGVFFSRDSFVPMERFGLEGEKGKDRIRVFSLPLGSYTMILFVYHPEIELCYSLSRDIDVFSGREVTLSIGPRRGGRIRLAALLPPGREGSSPRLKRISLRSLRDDREVACDARTFFPSPRCGCCCCFSECPPEPESPFPLSRCFEPGWYRLEVEFAGCLSAARNLCLDPGKTTDAVFHLLSGSP